VIDLATGLHRVVSVSSDGTANSVGTESPTISATGRFVTFQTTARNVVPGGPAGSARSPRLYLHDRDADEDGIYDEPGAIET
jgi:hypothetical protein